MVEEIEFETTNDYFPNSEIRQSYRIPADAVGKVVVDIYGSKFNAVDIGPTGVGIVTNYDGLFSSSEDLGGISIRIGTQKFTVKGKVVHITPRNVNEFHCGIAISCIYKDEKPAFEKAIYDLRKKIFIKSEITF